MTPFGATPVGGPPAPPLDARLLGRLRAVGQRLRGYLMIEGLAWVLGFLLLAFAVQFLFDYGTRGLRWSIRATLLAAILVAAAALVWRRLIRPLRVPVDVTDVANLVERRFPHLASGLISAVRFARGEAGPPDTNSPALMSAVISRAAQVAGDLNFHVVLDGRRAKWAFLAVLGVLVAGATAALGMPDLTRLWFARNVLLHETPWPKRTHLFVELDSGGLIGARGDDLVIQATAQGVQPGEVEFFYETAGGQRGRETMITVGSAGSYHYRYTFKNAQEDFSFHLRGGDDQTQIFQARLVDRPRVERAQMSVVPPSYTRLEAATLAENERATSVLPGSQVSIYIETNKPVSEAALSAGNDRVVAAEPHEAGHLARFTPLQSQTYHFALRDALGFDDREPLRFAIRVIKDEPPRVRLRVEGAGEMITPQAVLPVSVEYADTYGLATAELIFQLTHEDLREELIPLSEFEPHAKTFSTSLAWPVAAAGGVPGDRLILFAQGRDFDDVSGPNVAASPEIGFRVVTAEELMAELGRREQEFRMDFERLVDAQEDLRGRVLTIMGPAGPAAGSQEFGSSLADLERRQRSIAQSVGVVRQQVEQVLSELRINQLSSKEAEERLGGRIAEPLGRLTARDFPSAADSIRRWSRDNAAEVTARVDEQQVTLLSQMREILANMIQWEGYQEAVTMLRDILRLQNELKSETQNAVEKQAGEIFER